MARTKKEVVETPVVEAVEETVEKAPAKKTATKRTTKKATAETETAAKKTTKKAAAEKEPTAKKTTTRRTKKAVVNTEVYVQFHGKEVFTSELVENIKNAWAEANGKTPEEITDLKVYVKPEESRAYYVVNGEMTSTYDL